MRKTVFTKSMKTLIIALLLLAVFFPRDHSQKLMALALILWIAATIGFLLLRKSGKLFKKCRTLLSALKQSVGQILADSEKTLPPVQDQPAQSEEPIPPAKPALPASDSRECQTVLLHISLRITEKLKSAYPQSVWQWKDTPSLQGIRGH